MRKTRVIFVVLLAIFYSSVSLAQEPKPAGITKRKFKHNGEINAHYDPSSNKTTVVLNPYRISVSSTEIPENKEYFTMMCGFTYSGRTLTGGPDTIEFHIISDGTRGWKFDDDKKRILSISIDGERIQLGAMTVVRAKHYAYGGSPVNYARTGFLEELYTVLTYEAMTKIASGKRVSLNVGQQNIDLKNEHMEALRDLVSRMVP